MPIQDFSIEVAHDGAIARFTVTGPQNPENDAAIDDVIRAHCMRLGTRSALVDIRGMVGRLSVLANHEAALTFRNRLRGAVLAVAIVDLPEHHERSEMFELTATNRGTTIRSFDSVDEAERWLASLEAPPGSLPAG